MDAEGLSSFASEVLPLFGKLDDTQIGAAMTVLGKLKGKTPSRELLISTLCMLYSSWDVIKAGVAPFLWDGSQANAVMFCSGITPAPDAKKPSLNVSLKCLIGAPAGLSFSVVMSKALLEYIQGKFLGLSFRKYNSPAEHITGCYFSCTVMEDTSGTRLSDFQANETMKKLNKALAEKRQALTKCRTPLLECGSCKKTRKECVLAVWK